MFIHRVSLLDRAGPQNDAGDSRAGKLTGIASKGNTYRRTIQARSLQNCACPPRNE